jgi:dihydroflavonol-4-reductase
MVHEARLTCFGDSAAFNHVERREMDYLVTGATGLLGNNIVRLLVARGAAVRVLVRANSPSLPLADLDVQAAVGDVCQLDSVRAAARGARYIIHAAGDTHIGWHHLDRQRAINVTGSSHVAQAAREVGARMVHVSSVDTLPASPNGAPIDEVASDACKLPCTYVITKREAEQQVQAQIDQGLDAMIVHPGFMLGPWDWKPSSGKMLLAVARGWTLAAPGGGMSACDPRDVAQAIITAAERGSTGRHYILAGENIPYLAAWQLFARITGSHKPRFRVGPLVRMVVGRGGDLIRHWTGREPDVNSALVRMSQMLHYYSSERAREELDYRTRPLERSVQDAWDWFKEHHYVRVTAT